MMRKKFLQFFTGKLSKSIYIAVTSAVVCGVAVITTVVVVHNNNQRLDTALESLNEQTATMAQTESATEDVSVTEGNNNTTTPAQAANNEPAGDRALEYIAEYERITAEYEKKRAELVAQTMLTVTKPFKSSLYEPVSRAQFWKETSEEYSAYIKEYEEKLQQYEKASQAEEESRREVEKKAAEERERVEEAQKQIDALDAQYEKDITALKTQYGIG